MNGAGEWYFQGSLALGLSRVFITFLRIYLRRAYKLMLAWSRSQPIRKRRRSPGNHRATSNISVKSRLTGIFGWTPVSENWPEFGREYDASSLFEFPLQHCKMHVLHFGSFQMHNQNLENFHIPKNSHVTFHNIFGYQQWNFLLYLVRILWTHILGLGSAVSLCHNMW